MFELKNPSLQLFHWQINSPCTILNYQCSVFFFSNIKKNVTIAPMRRQLINNSNRNKNNVETVVLI